MSGKVVGEIIGNLCVCSCWKFDLEILKWKMKRCSGKAGNKKEEFEGQLWYLEILKMLKIGLSDVL